jgi:hypothetical protein
MIDQINNCKWIGKNPKLQSICCKSAVRDRSYCEDHVWLVYQKGSALAKRKKDIRRAEAFWNLESEFHQAIEELIAEGELEL